MERWKKYDNHEEDEQMQLEATFDQQMHSSEQNDCGPLILKEHGKEAEYRKAMSQLSPNERLKQNIGSIVKSLNDIIEISSNDRNEICRSVNNLEIFNIKAKYVSPLAYVLGYVAYHKGYINKSDKLNKEILNNLDNINIITGGSTNYAVFPPDVVRYMRFWNRIEN